MINYIINATYSAVKVRAKIEDAICIDPWPQKGGNFFIASFFLTVFCPPLQWNSHETYKLAIALYSVHQQRWRWQWWQWSEHCTWHWELSNVQQASLGLCQWPLSSAVVVFYFEDVQWLLSWVDNHGTDNRSPFWRTKTTCSLCIGTFSMCIYSLRIDVQ